MKNLTLIYALLVFFVFTVHQMNAQKNKIPNLVFFKATNPKNVTGISLTKTDFKLIRKSSNRQFNREFSKTIYNPNSLNSGAFLSSVPQVALESNFGEQKALANVGFQFGRGHTIALEAKQLFKEAPQKSTPLSLDGLTNNSSVSGGYQFVFSKQINVFDSLVIDTFFKIKAHQYVQDKQKKLKKADKCELIQKVTDSTVSYHYKTTDPLITDTLDVASFVKHVCCECDDTVYLWLKDYKLTKDDIYYINNMPYSSLDDEHKKMFRTYLKGQRKKIAFLNLRGGAEKNSFSYLSDSSDIYPVSVEKQNSFLKVGFGFFINWRRIQSALGFSYQMSDVYENDSDPISYNFPVGSNGARFNKDIQIGAPVHKINNKVSIEWRINFTDIGPLDNFAVSPNLSYAIEKNAISFNVPLYFLKNRDSDGKINGLSGGVNFSYNSKLEPTLSTLKDGFKANIFVAVPFDLIKGL